MNKLIGIYSITNTKNGKQYIGQSINIHERWKKHKYRLNKGIHINPHLQNAWNKYGKNSFEFKILKICKVKYLSRFEKLYIRIFDTFKNGYNRTTGGDANHKLSEDTKMKMSNVIRSDEFKKKVSENNARYWLGKQLSNETKQKLSKAHTGKPLSDEHKYKLSKSHNTSGFRNVAKCTYKNGTSYWIYSYYVNGKRKKISSIDLNILKNKVLSKGLLWEEF